MEWGSHTGGGGKHVQRYRLTGEMTLGFEVGTNRNPSHRICNCPLQWPAHHLSALAGGGELVGQLRVCGHLVKLRLVPLHHNAGVGVNLTRRAAGFSSHAAVLFSHAANAYKANHVHPSMASALEATCARSSPPRCRTPWSPPGTPGSARRGSPAPPPGEGPPS